MLKKLLGIAPQAAGDGSFIPSKLSLKMATSPTSNYTKVDFGKTVSNKKILVVCTEQSHMRMKNNKLFSTGNHPVETLVPMLHLRNAGYAFDIATPSGKPVALEMWAMPQKDAAVKALYEAMHAQFHAPLTFEKALAQFEQGDFDHVFIPGGHGAMLDLPENQHLSKLLRRAKARDAFVLTICHGPAALLSAQLPNEEFIFKGYRIAAFPDKVDEQTPLIGYMPGHLTWKFGEQLQSCGVEIINKKADKTCHVDRKLITGASPDAANDFGILASKTLLAAE